MNKESYIGFYNTPSIWHNEAFGIKQFQVPEIDIETFLPQEIPTNLRLGHKVEHIFQQLISTSNTHEIEVYNLPVREAKRTLGEIDFILKDKTNLNIIHVELTYKFYLIDPDFEVPIKRLIGPNRKDSFYEKIQKVKQKQFPLLQSESGRKALIEKGIQLNNIDQQCCFKAQIFRPYQRESIEIGPINKGCIIGYWLKFDEFKREEIPSAQYYLPQKTEWVQSPHHNVPWKSHIDIMNDINEHHKHKRAPMIWKKVNGVLEKLFVVWW